MGEDTKKDIKTEIRINAKDSNRCHIRCQHIRKIQGLYTCILYDEIVDEGDDDELGYGFKRTEKCFLSEI